MGGLWLDKGAGWTATVTEADAVTVVMGWQYGVGLGWWCGR